MRTLIRLSVAAALLAPALAPAQASVQVQLDLPVVLPPMVVVQPGVQVVPDQNEEVFFHNGWYWVRRDDGWYRSRSHRHGWMVVREDRVPRRLVALPPGQYRHWHPAPPPARPVPARYRPAPPPPRYAPAHEAHGPPRGDVRRATGDRRDEGRGHGRDHDRW